jgi:hypothetical protein
LHELLDPMGDCQGVVGRAQERVGEDVQTLDDGVFA